MNCCVNHEKKEARKKNYTDGAPAVSFNSSDLLEQMRIMLDVCFVPNSVTGLTDIS